MNGAPDTSPEKQSKTTEDLNAQKVISIEIVRNDVASIDGGTVKAKTAKTQVDTDRTDGIRNAAE